jgi:hypothetical protein
MTAETVKFFWRSFELNKDLDQAFYMAEGDYTGHDTKITKALFIGNYYGLDYFQIEELINKAK